MQVLGSLYLFFYAYGFGKHGKVLKLKKSMCGLEQSPRNFFQHLNAKLELVGFKYQEDIDPCIFISDRVICLVYVNATLIFAPEKYLIQ